MSRRLKESTAEAAQGGMRNVPLLGNLTPKSGSASVPGAKSTKAPEALKVPVDPVHEAIVIAAAAMNAQRRKVLTKKVFTDHFLVREHNDAWAAIVDLDRKGLDYSPETVESLHGAETARTLARIVDTFGGTEPANLDHHVSALLWDRAVAAMAQGPLQNFLEAIKENADPEKLRGFARAIDRALEGHGQQSWIHDSTAIVHEQMRDIEQRVAGRAVWPYGIHGLDFFDKELREGQPKRRMIPGAAPGQITTITAMSGGGKTTFTANVALGIQATGRKVLWGAWEMRGGMTLELLAIISLGWSRGDVLEGEGYIRTHEARVIIEERMHELSKRVHIMKNPFHRKTVTGKPSNERNLDLLHGILADAGCDVFIADLWKRLLRDASPEAEEDALTRQQSMAEELGQHHILLQQQRLKDIETRDNKQPTREGIKGSSAWVEVSDTIIGVHRPALWKAIDDNILQAFILKQRFGKWPLGVEFNWDPDIGIIRGGKAISYDRPGEGNEIDAHVGPRGLPWAKGKR